MPRWIPPLEAECVWQWLPTGLLHIGGIEVRFYLGLDLGQRQDHSAIAVVEKLEQGRPYGEPVFEALLVRHAERVPLGTTYPEVVERVRTLLETPEIEGQCELVVDATGVGAPVVDLLRLAGL